MDLFFLVVFLNSGVCFTLSAGTIGVSPKKGAFCQLDIYQQTYPLNLQFRLAFMNVYAMNTCIHKVGNEIDLDCHF